ncbi:hypothetical protein [Pseudomonas aeruginosa]|uniref:hypothetical protein n=1 Tax=Pseudomonas aeruginosa TaxID=287 RepID=UPI000F542D87|nr:hypothetical protein [Pseudomonas aeruginosa]RQD17414.1 hypothetical protein IPC346_02790 [Pseudomonas aeruginosa]
MTKANECTCPSGDGSLRHPCPAHPAVEQAGGDERAAFRPAQVISYRPGVGEVTIYVAGRVPGYMNIGDTVYVSDRAPVEQPIAALAQPSPVSEALIYACKNLAQITSSDGSGHADIALAVLRMAGVGDDERERLVNEWKAARAWKPSPAQAEAERPPQPERYTADVFHPERPYYMAQTSVVRASDFDEFATQYERIVGALRFERQQMDRAFTACINGRDAALARVTELENQEPVAWMDPRSPEMHATISNEVKQHNMRIGNAPASAVNGYSIPLYAAPVAQAQQLHDLDKQCRDDVARALGLRPNEERGFAWSYLLASIKSCVKASEDTTQAQHGVPGNAAALVRAEGKKYSLNAAGMLDSGAPEHAQTFAIVQLLSEFDDEEAESHWEAIMAYSDFRTSDALFHAAELLAAAPGKEGV